VRLFGFDTLTKGGRIVNGRRGETPMSSLENRLKTEIEKGKRQLEEFGGHVEQLLKTFGSLPPDITAIAKELLAERLGLAGITQDQPIHANDLAGKTSLQCARIILRERGNAGTHFSAIVREAMRRGYRGRVDGSPEVVETTLMKSFWAALSRANDMEKVGNGMYRLRGETRTAPVQQQSALTVEAQSMVGKAARILRELGRPMRVRDIVKELHNRGLFDNRPERELRSALSSAICRRRDLFAKSGRYVTLRTTDFALL